ncbi:UBA/TS-N domain-containing protein [Coprinopsis sp. MPI-PUGE-AT-0042]|nr:UBA/TS-N domain-containing protein [Coprinopsis sp. MPI-PUGE-AT-0042]
MVANLSPTPAEATLVNQIFLHADPQKLGVITSDAAVKVFDGSKLPATVLGEIWAMADEDNNGWLSRKGVAIVVRLMGWAQKGEAISPALLQKPGPLPRIEGVNSVAQQNTGMSLGKTPLPYFPPLSPEDRTKFSKIFMNSGPANGLLSGEKARDIFLKSKLPNEQLIQIWNLADTQDRGSLDATDFAIGMYFIQGLMANKISFIPTSLPPGLYQQASGAVASHMTGGSGSFSPSAGSNFNIQPQYTGQMGAMNPNHTGMSSLSNQARSPALPPRPAVPSIARTLSPPVKPPAAAWDVSPAEKAASDQWFEGLDKDRKGFIEGSVAVPFMVQSGLPGEILATIWDLSDINNDGTLNRDCFAVAWHLIQTKLGGGEIPTVLPSSLVPPSMRGTVHQAHAPQQDLFSFDDSPPPSAVAQHPTGGPLSMLQPQSTGPLSSMSPQATGARATPTMHDPFTQSITPQYTNSSRNFLDDDDAAPHATSPPLHDQSAEIGNVTNQLNSTNQSMEKTRRERESIEQALSAQAAQLSSLQLQLSSAKAAYETETKLFTTLKDRHTTQQAEIDKARHELITAESDLSAKRVEKAEIEGAFMRDKEDHRELNRQMIAVGQQIEAIKAETEKLKKDAKQQKGLLAIAKKQLATKEAERAKVEKELQDAHEELSAITNETEETETALAKLEMPTPVPARAPPPPIPERATSADVLAFAVAQPLPATPDLAASPSVSIRSNNPFDRLAKGGSTSRTQSPFQAFPPATTKSPSSIHDDLFGLSDGPTSPEGGRPSVEGLPYDGPASKSPEPAKDLVVPQVETQDAVSPSDNESFHTPPTSARTLADPPSENPSLDNIASKFPSIDAIATPPVADAKPVTNGKGHNDDFDSTFNSKVEELEIEESDSDSDSEDEVPLAVLSSKRDSVAQGNDELKTPTTSKNETFDDIFASPTQPKAATSATASEFDDIFSPAKDTPNPQEGQTNGKVVTASPEGFPTAAPAVAGVDAFDEALGLGSSAAKGAPAPTFSFDNAFDDNFDFNAAKSDFPPVASSLPQQAAAPVQFDDIFGAPAPALNGQAAASAPVGQPEAPKVPELLKEQSTGAMSFDEAFGGTPAVSNAPPAPVVTAGTETTGVPPPATSNNPFPVSSPPTSPKQAASASKPRPASPLAARTSSPPPRIASPKPRLSSSSSSKDAPPEKPAPPPARHSKLSLRLPFTKKKKDKQQQQEPMPSKFLAPHPEAPRTPAVDDDVDAVKTLTDMGFSRTQAVEALEKYGYDVQRALNNLLGAP